MGPGTAYLFGLVFGVFACGAAFLILLDSGRTECTREHNVYNCEYVGQWQPAPPKQD